MSLACCSLASILPEARRTLHSSCFLNHSFLLSCLDAFQGKLNILLFTLFYWFHFLTSAPCLRKEISPLDGFANNLTKSRVHKCFYILNYMLFGNDAGCWIGIVWTIWGASLKAHSMTMTKIHTCVSLCIWTALRLPSQLWDWPTSLETTWPVSKLAVHLYDEYMVWKFTLAIHMYTVCHFASTKLGNKKDKQYPF